LAVVSVLTVPMRNGNDRIKGINVSTKSSYRTYEEWKQTIYEVERLTRFVLTVPMRNGNFWMIRAAVRGI